MNQILYPPRCPVCDEVLFDRDSMKPPCICKDCERKLTFIREPYCMRCGKQLEAEEQEYCHDCLAKRTRTYFSRGVAAFSYSDAMKRSMYAFKYHNRREYASYYADIVMNHFGDTLRSWDAQALIPVPLHPAKLRQRGYNQAAVFAGALGERLALPVDPKVLFRVRRTKAQKLLKDAERIKNIENAFQIKQNELKYKKVILVDDIYTTGTTINECARVLLSAGAEAVYFAAVCAGAGF